MQELEDRLIKIGEVCQLIGSSKSTIYRLMGQGRFPQRVVSNDGAARWRLREVMDWIRDLDDTPPGVWE